MRNGVLTISFFLMVCRGEKAFCSTECRNRQIVSDERKEKCGSEASKTSDSSLFYDSGRLFSPGVVAV